MAKILTLFEQMCNTGLNWFLAKVFLCLVANLYLNFYPSGQVSAYQQKWRFFCQFSSFFCSRSTKIYRRQICNSTPLRDVNFSFFGFFFFFCFFWVKIFHETFFYNFWDTSSKSEFVLLWSRTWNFKTSKPSSPVCFELKSELAFSNFYFKKFSFLFLFTCRGLLLSLGERLL